MLPVLSAIGTGLSVLSSINSLISNNKPTVTTPPTAAEIAAASTKNNASTSTSGAKASTEQQDRFLKLLVTQMQNQDPLNPMDNAQVTTQLAQINTVSGIEKLNSTVQGLSSSLLQSQSLQSASMIGREVYASGSYLNLEGGRAVGGVDLKQQADRVYISIADPSGVVVRRLELGSAKAGLSAFHWDGKSDAGTLVPDGAYVFQATAARGNSTVSIEPITQAKVEGVSLGNGGMTLNLEGGGAITLADVKRIL
jgi:flagellar basal-body rod modification protein FlgD